MKNEDVVELSVYRPHHAHYGALILSVIWNFLVLICIFFLARQKQNIIFHVPRDPVVTFQNPTIPAQFPQSIASPQMPVQPAQPVAQQLPQTLQQIAQQQPLDLPSPDQEELNYLVRQLISDGNRVCGAVVSAVDDVPDSADLPISQPDNETFGEHQPAALEKQSEASTQQESKEPEKTPAQGVQASNQEYEITNQPISPQDAELLKETVEAIETTLAADSNVYVQQRNQTNKGSIVPQSSTHSGYAQHQLAQIAAQPTKHRTVSLSDIANTFMKQVRNERDIKYNYDPQKKSGGPAGVYSPANKACDGKQLALQMYASKVFMLMQQSAHALSSLIYAHANFTAESLLEITIDHDGKLLRASLNPPINEKDIEQAVQTIVQRVGLFPPIPKHFNTDSITLTFPLNIQGSKGFGRYSLSYSVAGQP